MEFIHLLLHLDRYLADVVAQYHNYYYALLFIVIFCETGLIVTPFLPGDSLLFLSGAIAATGNELNFTILAIIIFCAAFLGDNTNFTIGKTIGKKLFSNPNSKIFKQSILTQTHQIYEKHGAKAIILARFTPIMRTFVPFVAGIGRMHYQKYISYSIISSVLWVLIFVGGGYVFSNIPVVKDHLSLLILVVIFLSALPFAFIFARSIFCKKQ